MRQILLSPRTGLRASEMALGCGLLGARGSGIDAEIARATLAAFAEAGGTLIDASSAHGGGRSEELIGSFLAERGRDQFVVSTKYGRGTGLTGGNARGAMLVQVEASLRRLHTDRIDLYSVEFPDGITPAHEVMRGLDTLVRQGKVVHAALSNFAAWEVSAVATFAEARGWVPLAALHYQYSLLERSAEREHLPMADAFGLGVLAWSPQARGRLAREDLDGVDEQVARPLAEVAGRHGAPNGAVALAWLLAKGVVPVVGARDPGQLAQSLRAPELMLTEEDLRVLDGAMPPSTYPADLVRAQREGVAIDGRMIGQARAFGW